MLLGDFEKAEFISNKDFFLIEHANEKIVSLPSAYAFNHKQNS